MIDSVLNLLFRCSHRRLTRPVSAISKAGQPHSDAYVVCLDCGKQFSYDVQKMKIGKPLPSSHEAGVLHPAMPKPHTDKVKIALWASVPLALFGAAVLKGGKPRKGPDGGPSGK